MESNKYSLIFSHFVITLMCVISIALLSRFQEWSTLLNATVPLKNQEFFQAMHGLIGMDALILLQSFFGIIVMVKPNKSSVYTYNLFQTLMLIVRFILSVIFLAVYEPQNIDNTVLKSTEDNSIVILQFLHKTFSQAYRNEIACAVIIPVFQIISIGNTQKLQIDAD